MSNTRAFFFSDDLSSSFVLNDLTLFARRFNKVTVVTSSGWSINTGFSNVELLLVNDSGYSTSKTVLANFFSIISIAFGELFSYPAYLLKPRFFVSMLSNLLRCFYKAGQISSHLSKEQAAGGHVVLYSFWFNDWATVLSILKKNKIISRFYSRAHGADLFEERSLNGKLPLRHFQLRYIDRVFSVSQKGTDYLRQRYPQFSSKIFTSFLGSDEGGTSQLNPEAVFTIVSCARIRDIKRIHLLPEILKRLGFPLRWVHIGGENTGDPTLWLLHKNLEALKEGNPQVEIDFMGDLDNPAVFEFYAANSVNLFISVSETEGLPVSMMEAISFGIPVLATNVGGCNEIVTGSTGILIPAEFDPAEVARGITQFRDSKMNTREFRTGVKEFWKTNFNSEANFQRFAELIN